MIQRFVFVLIAMLGCVACSAQPDTPPSTYPATPTQVPSPASGPYLGITAEEYAVYSGLLKIAFNGSQKAYVILDTTMTSYAGQSLTTADTLQYIRTPYPDLDQRAMDDFAQKNKRPYSIQTRFTSGVKAFVVSKQEIVKALTGDRSEFLTRLQSNYGASGVLILSRAGISTNGKHEIVCYDLNGEWYLGGVWCVHLSLTERGWVSGGEQRLMEHQ
jgi:hypothetical protein